MVDRSSQSGQRGAILLLLMVTVVIVGLAAGMAGQSWRATMQREREAELLWRGQQYQQAIARYYAVQHGSLQMFPAKLEHLERDPRFPGTVRHLRKAYKDPMTGEDFELVTDPSERIMGVRSKSDLEPFRKDGFPPSLDKLKDKNSYQEWEFVFEPPTRQQQGRNATRANRTATKAPVAQ